MAEIHKLESANQDTTKSMARLHELAFPQFFLTQLGTGFLSTLYKGYLEDNNSGIIVATVQEKLVGLIAYSGDYSLFFKHLIKHHLFKFALCSAGAAIKHPSFIKRLCSAFGKSTSVKRDEPYVELASICVDPAAEGQGIGSALIDYLKSIVDFELYDYISLETDALENEKANQFYVKNGFILERQYTTAEGRRMNEYRYYSK